jgi:DNA primase
MLSAEQKQLLTETAAKYHETINAETVSYLRSRGISKEVAVTFLLGTVNNPAPGHEHAEGCLSIPYITPTGVVGIKFRKIDGGQPKYIWPTGQKIGMFNVKDLIIDTDTMCICEGEVDTMVLSGLCGIPAVGVAGVTQWKEHFPIMFEGYKRIFVFADNDVKEDGRNPGMELAKRIKEDLNNAVVVNLPENKDVNDVFLREGADWFKEKIK